MEITRTDLIILAILADKPSYGWDIDATLSSMGAAHWAEYSRPHLYYSLRKLQKNGFIELLPGEGARLKKPYRLTAKGRSVLSNEKEIGQLQYNKVYFAFDLLLAFPNRFQGGKTHWKELLRNRREMIEEELSEVQQLWQDAEREGSIPFGRVAVFKHRISFLKAELDFLKWLEKNTPQDWESLMESRKG